MSVLEGLTKENIIVKLKMMYDIKYLQFIWLIGPVRENMGFQNLTPVRAA
jgi:hypothetical protein